MLFQLIYGILKVIGHIPLPILYKFSDFVFVIVYHIVGYRKKVVRTNLANSFPEKNPIELKSLERKFYRHFCDVLVEIIAMAGMSTKELLKRYKFLNPEVIDYYFKNGRTITSVAGHMGNWEWFSVYSAASPYDCVVIYKPLANKIFDKLMFHLRSKNGYRPVAMQFVLKEYIQAKIEKRIINAFFIADQTPMRNEIKFWTRFLNQDTPIYLGSEKIARKFNTVIIYIHITKPRRGYYEARFIPVFDDLTGTDESQITNAHVKLLESNIIEQPEIWLWSHRRWKHKKDTL